MASDLSLLFQLRADNAQAKAVLADTRAAVTQLRSQFGKDLTSMQGIAKSALSDIGENVNAFVGQRIPLIGGAFLRVTSNLKGFNDELKKGGPQTKALAEQIDSIAKSSGKSSTEISKFLTTFVRLEGQTARNNAAFKFFGGSVDLIGNKTAKFLPELEQAGGSLAALSTEATGVGASMAAMAGPIGIAVAALAAEAVVVISLTKEIFNLARATADYQGKLYDLSQQTGVSVETLSALEVVARTTGSSIEALVQSLGIFQRHLEEAVEDRGSKAAKTFRQLGVDATDTEAALRQTVAALARMPEGFRQTATALEVFGRGGKAFLAIAKESNGDIDEITRRLKNLGLVTTDQAKRADEFNDQLVLLEIQLRGIGTEAIPVVLDVLKDLSKTLEENRDVIKVLHGVVKGLALAVGVPLKVAIGIARAEFEKASPIFSTVADVLQRIKSAVEFITQHPIKLPSILGSGDTSTVNPNAPASQKDPFTEQLTNEVEARKRLQAVLNAELAARQQQAKDSIALAQREFEAGKRNREQLLQVTIDGNRRQTQAEIEALEIERKIKLQEQALAKNDLEKRTQLSNAIIALDTQIANKRAEQQRSEADLRAKARLDEQKEELTHQQANLEILTRLGNERIAVIEDQIRRETADRQTGIEEIERIENAALAARGQLLKRELELAGVGPDRRVVLDKITAIETERTELERRQSERRKQITEEEFATKRQIVLSNLDAVLQIEQIRGNARIATIKALADLGVKTEEQAAKETLAIRLRLLDSEIEATKIRLKAAAGIVDPNERRQAENDLINSLKVLNAAREAVQEEGDRQIDEGRRRDLENERRYADELEELRERVRDFELDAAAEAIRLMQSQFARRKDIIRAQRDLDLAEEEARHRRATDSINRQKQEIDAEIKTLEKRLERLTIGTTEEIEQYERIIAALERLRQKRLELERQQEAEDRRNQTRKRRVTKDSKDEEDESDPLGRFKINVEKFARDLEKTVVPLGDILKDTFLQVADAIGQVVANYVLLGETGPAVMRKILAQALASIAAEAAVNAVKELALGFATLFFNPAESAAHFTAAGLWAGIAGGTALAGRAVAGDLFKQKSAGGSGGQGGSASSPQALNPIVQNRNQQQTITIILRPDESAFGKLVTATVVDDIGNGGVIREVINSDGR